MRNLLSLLLITLCSFQSFAESLYDVKVNGVRIYDKFIAAGVPKPALERVFEFLDVNAGKTVKVEAKVRSRQETKIQSRAVKIHEEFVGIIDFSLPSDEKRLYVLNLETGEVTRHLVAHGKGSGVSTAAKFSNIPDSKMTSLGLYLAGDTYTGKHGVSMNLYGLEASNNKAARRDIVMHSAAYVSDAFAKEQGRIGRSWGCPAVSPQVIGKMITTFHDGGLIYAYHKDISESTLKNPNLQVLEANDEDDVDLPGEEETLRKGEREADPLNDDQVGAVLQKIMIPIPLPRPEYAPEDAPTVYTVGGIPVPVPRPSTEIPATPTPEVVAPVTPEVPAASVTTPAAPTTVEDAIKAGESVPSTPAVEVKQ